MLKFTEDQKTFIKEHIKTKNLKWISDELDISVYYIRKFCEKNNLIDELCNRRFRNPKLDKLIEQRKLKNRKLSTEGPAEPNFVWAYNKLSDYGVKE